MGLPGYSMVKFNDFFDTIEFILSFRVCQIHLENVQQYVYHRFYCLNGMLCVYVLYIACYPSICDVMFRKKSLFKTGAAGFFFFLIIREERS